MGRREQWQLIKMNDISVIDEIADNIGRKWADLARALDLKEGYITEIEDRYPGSLRERAYQVISSLLNLITIE